MSLAIRHCCGTAAFFLVGATMVFGCDSTTETDGAGGGGTASSGAIVIAGVFWGSCVPDDGVNSTIDSLYNGQSKLLKALDPSCFTTKSNGCAAVADCAGVTVDLTGPCTESCANGLWDACDDSLHFSVECAQLGMTCSAEINECISEPLGAACDSSTFEWTCDGTDLVYCSQGYEQRTPCADFGMVCGTDGYDAACMGAGPACDDDTMMASCDGGDIVMCLYGQEHRVSCASLQNGWSCHQTGDGPVCGTAAECLAGERNASCDGNDIVLCNAGRTERVDCTALGFERCDDSGNRAVCAPSGWLN